MLVQRDFIYEWRQSCFCFLDVADCIRRPPDPVAGRPLIRTWPETRGRPHNHCGSGDESSFSPSNRYPPPLGCLWRLALESQWQSPSMLKDFMSCMATYRPVKENMSPLPYSHPSRTPTSHQLGINKEKVQQTRHVRWTVRSGAALVLCGLSRMHRQPISTTEAANFDRGSRG